MGALLTSGRLSPGQVRGSILVFLALLLIPTLGPHKVNENFGLEELGANLRSDCTRIFILVNIVVAAAIAALAYVWRNEYVKMIQIEESSGAASKLSHPPPLVKYNFQIDVMIWAAMASDTAAWTFMLVKLSMTCVFNLESWAQLLYVLPVLFTTVSFVIVLPNIVYHTTGRFPSAVVIPVYQTTTMFLTTVHGGIFLSEFHQFSFLSARGMAYLGSFALAGLGIRQLHTVAGDVKLVGGHEGLLHGDERRPRSFSDVDNWYPVCSSESPRMPSRKNTW